MDIKKRQKNLIFNFSRYKILFLLLAFFIVASCFLPVNSVEAIDGLMNGKRVTGQTDNYLFWLQSYDKTTSPYYYDRLFLNKNGEMGIGTITPAAALDVQTGSGHSILAGSMKIGNVATPGANTDAVNKGYVDDNFAPLTGGGYWERGGNTLTAKDYIGSTNNFGIGLKTNNTERITITNDGKVGIGATVPLSDLHIANTFQIGTDSLTGNRTAVIWAENGYEANLKFLETPTYGMGIRYNANLNYLAVDRYVNSATPTGSLFSFRDSGDIDLGEGTLFIDYSESSVGIGTATPAAALDVQAGSGHSILAGNMKIGNVATPVDGTDAVNKTYVDDAISGASGADLDWTISGTDMYSGVSGNVGIGINSPDYKLDVNGTGRFSGDLSVNGDGTVPNAPTSAGFYLGKSLLDENRRLEIVTGATTAYIDFTTPGTDYLGRLRYDTDTNKFRFYTNATEKMVIDSIGNVGIGIATPAAALDVQAGSGHSILAGNMKIGNVATPGANTDAVNKGYVDDNFMSIGTAIDDGDWIVSGTDMYSGVSGNVGIGTNSPTSLLTIANDNWISAIDGAGTGSVNMFKVNSSNQIEVGSSLLIGPLEFAADSGLISFIDMPVTSAAVSGAAEGYTFKIDGSNILTVFSKSNGSGGVTNLGVGLGTITPAAGLDVQLGSGHSILAGNMKIGNVATPVDGTDAVNKTYVDDAISGASGADLDWTISGTDMYSGVSGNVGVGTNSPGSKFHVDGSSGLPSTANSLMTLRDSVSNIGFQMGATTGRGWIRSVDVGNSFATYGVLNLGNNYVTLGDGADENQFYLNTINGNVGIGTATPAAALDAQAGSGHSILAGSMKIGNVATPVDGTDAVNKTYVDDAISGASGADLDWTISGTDMYSGVSGNVGIGATTPSQKLDVVGNINIDSASAYLFDGSTALKLSKNGETDYYSTLVGHLAGNPTSASSTRQTALGYTAGYLNKGAFQIVLGYRAGHSNSGVYQTALGYSAGQLNTGANQIALGYHAGYSNSGASQIALGYLAGFSNTGNQAIGIGYESTRGNSGNDVVAIGYQAGKDNAVANQFIIKQANINNVPLIQGDFSSGNVGIGTTTPSEKLTVSGNVEAVAYYYSSDERLKKNVQTIDGAMDIIKKLNPVSFNWKKDDVASQGFIAQELEQVIPELVKTNSINGLKAVQYANLTAVLTAGIQEQQKEIDYLKTMVEILKLRVNDLESK